MSIKMESSIDSALAKIGLNNGAQDAEPPMNEPKIDGIKPEPNDVDPTPNSKGTLQDGLPLRPADEILAPSNGGPGDDELEPMCASPVTEESASSADIPSSSEDDTLSSDEDLKYYDGEKWCCQDCHEPVADCNCGTLHTYYACEICDSEALDMEFCTNCSNCHQSLEGPCAECWVPELSEEDMEDLSELFWDRLEQVWRCGLCFWEVEANDENEGHCHCPSEQSPSLLRRIELAEYPDYGPADSDSSGANSTDSEPDSGDEEFVEDDGPFVLSFAHLLAGNYDPFEKVAPPELEALGTGGAAVATGGEVMDVGADTLATGGEAMDTGGDT
ncbi:MAG: hypothetical protein Q9208_003360 [Pyrenodesmia sp. 3 TL-2023]